MKAIFWDLDGVLINSMNTHAISWQKALKEHKLTVTKKQLMEMGGLSYKDTIIEIAKQNKKNLTKEEINIIFERKKEIMNKLKSKVKPYNIKSELKQLNNKNIKQYIVTGSIKKYAQEEIKKHFPNIFEDIISANDVKNSKPHPDPYLKALKETKLKKKIA